MGRGPAADTGGLDSAELAFERRRPAAAIGISASPGVSTMVSPVGPEERRVARGTESRGRDGRWALGLSAAVSRAAFEPRRSREIDERRSAGTATSSGSRAPDARRSVTDPRRAEEGASVPAVQSGGAISERRREDRRIPRLPSSRAESKSSTASRLTTSSPLGSGARLLRFPPRLERAPPRAEMFGWLPCETRIGREGLRVAWWGSAPTAGAVTIRSPAALMAMVGT